MKRILLATLIVALVVTAIAGCGSKATLGAGVAVASGAPTEGDANAAADPALGAAISGFGIELLKAASKDAEGPNTVVSPLSVHASLSMAANGADGKTAEEMLSVLRLTGGIETANGAYANALASLGKVEGTTLDIANSIWVDEGFELKPGFVDADRKYFGAELATLDLQAKGKEAINDWVAKQTRDKITDLIDQVPDDAVAYLVNAVYMKGEWATAFDPELTTDRDFEVWSGATAPLPTPKHRFPVPMMTRDGSFTYYEGRDGTKAVRLPYKDGRLGMWVVLPPLYRNNTPDSLTTWLGALDAATWNTIVSSAGEREGTLTMPRFTTKQRTDLATVLSGMGMGDAFDPGAADFSKMAGERLVISRVLHETYVAVDEKGTEAAAATGTEMQLTSAPIGATDRFEMTVDRPFVFAIDDSQTGALLFLGRIGDPR